MEEPLIPGLPDHLAMQCLLRISHGFHPTLQAVCKGWHRLISSPEYARAQAKEGKCGDWLFVLTEETEDQRWNAYDPSADRWHFLPHLPGRSSTFHRGFASVGVANKFLVLGGYTVHHSAAQFVRSVVTNEVFQFDPFTKKWSKAASMRVPRCNFACAAVGGKVFVAGGCSSSRRSRLVEAEVYDPAEDKWQDISPLPSAREDCVGVGISHMFYVIAGVPDNHADQKRIDVFDVQTSVWYSLPDMWLFSRQMPCPVTVIGDCIYALDDWDTNFIKVCRPQQRGWKKLSPVRPVQLPEHSRPLQGFNYGMISLRNQLYVFGGKVLKWERNGQWNKFDILRLNSVNVCTPGDGNTEVSWRNLRHMGECRGAVLGCAGLEE